MITWLIIQWVIPITMTLEFICMIYCIESELFYFLNHPSMVLILSYNNILYVIDNIQQYIGDTYIIGSQVQVK